MIKYQIEDRISTEEFTTILVRSTLGERRPVDDPGRLSEMIRNSNLIVTARDRGKLVGIARSITDFVYCTYLSDLAVDKDYQKLGIGRELIRRTKTSTPLAKLILLSAPMAVDYYLKINMNRHPNCFYLDDLSDLK